MPTTYIANTDHYNLVLSRVASVKKSLWIGTAKPANAASSAPTRLRRFYPFYSNQIIHFE